MLMKLSDGTGACERFFPGRMVYVPPFWAHRTVNTGEEPLVSFCAYPGDAGHNYGDIEKEGFPLRVFKRAGVVQVVNSIGRDAAGGRARDGGSPTSDGSPFKG
jgi:glucose-6-phosphate isomerase, archaeal